MAKNPYKGLPDFMVCVASNLRTLGYGLKKIKAVGEVYKNLHENNMRNGQSHEASASKTSFDFLMHFVNEKNAKEAVADAKAVHIERFTNQHIRPIIDNFLSKPEGHSTIKDSGFSMLLDSVFDVDPRAKGSGFGNFETTKRSALDLIYKAGLDFALNGKGYWGNQKLNYGTWDNVIRELLGEGTTDDLAKKVAKGFQDSDKAGVALFRDSGGVMNTLENYVPQTYAAPKIAKAGKEQFTKDMIKSIDWNKTLHPDGTRVESMQDKEDYISSMYDNILSNGVSKMEKPGDRVGTKVSVGNRINDHRQVFYNDFNAFKDIHSAYSSGSFFDVLNDHLENRAHNISLLRTFGPTPEVGYRTMKNAVLMEANIAKQKFIDGTYAPIKGFDPQNLENLTKQNTTGLMQADNIFKGITSRNQYNFDTAIDVTLGITKNLLRSVQLGSVIMKSAPADIMQHIQYARTQGRNGFRGIGSYWKGVLNIFNHESMQNSYGTYGLFVQDMNASIINQSNRYDMSGFKHTSQAINLSKITEGSVWRASGVYKHDQVLQRVIQKELTRFFHDNKGKDLDSLPLKIGNSFKNYGINQDDWNAISSMPNATKGMLTPADVFESGHSDSINLGMKLSNMMHAESYNEFHYRPHNKVASLSNSFEGNSLLAKIGASMLMYKSFPLTYTIMQSRKIIANNPTTTGRLGALANSVALMTVAGGIGVIMSDLTQGKVDDPTSPQFAIRALASGGGLGLAGDALVGASEGVDMLNGVASGPLINLAGKSGALSFEYLKYMYGSFDPNAQWTLSNGNQIQGNKILSDTVKFLPNLTPGSNLWYARLAMQTFIRHDILQNVDPEYYQHEQDSINNLKRSGQAYLFNPWEGKASNNPYFGN